MSGEQPSPLGDSDYREIAEEIAEEKKESDERLLSGEQLSPLDDSDYREIAEEIAEEKKADEGLLSSEQLSLMGDSDYREIAEEIAEEVKEPDERLLSSPRSNSQTARSSGIGEWLITRFSGILDEIGASLILAGILYIFGRLSGYLSGTPVTWLKKSSAIWYLITSVTLVTMAIIGYIIWQRKRR